MGWVDEQAGTGVHAVFVGGLLGIAAGRAVGELTSVGGPAPEIAAMIVAGIRAMVLVARMGWVRQWLTYLGVLPCSWRPSSSCCRPLPTWSSATGKPPRPPHRTTRRR